MCPSALLTSLTNVHRGVKNSRTTTFINGGPARTKIAAQEMIGKSCHDTCRTRAVSTSRSITANCVSRVGLGGDVGADQVAGEFTMATSTTSSTSVSSTGRLRSHRRRLFESRTLMPSSFFLLVICPGLTSAITPYAGGSRLEILPTSISPWAQRYQATLSAPRGEYPQNRAKRERGWTVCCKRSNSSMTDWAAI